MYKDHTVKSVQQSQSSSIVGIAATKPDMMPLASWTQYLENISCLIIGIPHILNKFLLFVDLVLLYPIFPGSLFDSAAVAAWQGSASSCLCEGLNEIHWAETVLLPVSASVSTPKWLYSTKDQCCTQNLVIVQILCDADGRTD